MLPGKREALRLRMADSVEIGLAELISISLSKEEFDENILNYNTTPRKSLKWLTPLEAFKINLHPLALHS